MDILFIIGGVSVLVLLFVIGLFINFRETKQRWEVISTYKYVLRDEDWLELEECCKKSGMTAAIALFEKYYDRGELGFCTYKGYMI